MSELLIERQSPLAPAELRAMVAATYGSSATLESAELMPGGTINTTYHLHVRGEAPAILRAAPTVDAVESAPSWFIAHGLRREHAAMARVPALRGVVPETIRLDTSHAIIERDWTIQTMLPGVPWSEAKPELTPDDEDDLWRQLGEIARTIHAVPGDAFGAVGVPANAFTRWSDLLVDDAEGLIRDAERFRLPLDEMSSIRSTIERHRAVLDGGTQPRLVHSDLNPRHVFIRPTPEGGHRLCGLIDMEFARFADPLSESTFTLFALDSGNDAGGYDAFMDGYGELPPGRDAELRVQIYVLIALGWIATDLAHQGNGKAVQRIFGSLTAHLGSLDG